MSPGVCERTASEGLMNVTDLTVCQIVWLYGRGITLLVFWYWLYSRKVRRNSPRKRTSLPRGEQGDLGFLLNFMIENTDRKYWDQHDRSRFCPTRSERGRPTTITSVARKTTERWSGWNAPVHNPGNTVQTRKNGCICSGCKSKDHLTEPYSKIQWEAIYVSARDSHQC